MSCEIALRPDHTKYATDGFCFYFAVGFTGRILYSLLYVATHICSFSLVVIYWTGQISLNALNCLLTHVHALVCICWCVPTMDSSALAFASWLCVASGSPGGRSGFLLYFLAGTQPGTHRGSWSYACFINQSFPLHFLLLLLLLASH